MLIPLEMEKINTEYTKLDLEKGAETTTTEEEPPEEEEPLEATMVENQVVAVPADPGESDSELIFNRMVEKERVELKKSCRMLAAGVFLVFGIIAALDIFVWRKKSRD